MTKLVQWNVSDMNEPVQEIDDSMIPADPPGYIPSAPEQEEAIEDFVESIEEDEDLEEQDDASILLNASLRLERGHLYKMLMTADIFQNLDVDPQAIKSVQRELKRFAKDRMEVMLGIKQSSDQRVTVQSQFNSLEVDVLKSLAKKLSGGASEKQSQPAQPQPAPKNAGLTPISGNSNKTKAAVKAAVSAKVNKQVSNKQPVKQTISPELANKKIEDMSYEEKLEYNRQKSAIYNSRKATNPDAIPMPSQAKLNAINDRKGITTKTDLGSNSLNNAYSSVVQEMLKR